MNVQILIDSIVQQTTVLIAQLATSGGVRAPLAHVANQVFSDLALELERQGLSRKVTADMFGISLRSYQRRVVRVRESVSERGRSLWEAVFEYLSSRGVTTRAEVLTRFNRDDEELVRGILRDLVESGVVFSTGTGVDTVYRATGEEEFGQLRSAEAIRGLDEFVWAVVYRQGPVTLPRLAELVKVPLDEIKVVAARLVDAGRIQQVQLDGEPQYRSMRLVVENGAAVGWEASVYDHFQAMVRTIGARLTLDQDVEAYRSNIGGSTYGLEVGPDHPLREEVLGVLADFRTRLSDLRQRVVAYNDAHPSTGLRERVVVYAGEVVSVDHKDEQP